MIDKIDMSNDIMVQTIIGQQKIDGTAVIQIKHSSNSSLVFNWLSDSPVSGHTFNFQ